jgi:hypothetical protein
MSAKFASSGIQMRIESGELAGALTRSRFLLSRFLLRLARES